MWKISSHIVKAEEIRIDIQYNEVVVTNAPALREQPEARPRRMISLSTSDSPVPYGYCQCGCGLQTSVAKRNEYDRGYLKGQRRRFVESHSNHKRRGPYSLEPYKIEERGHDTPCWIWQRSIQDGGYGKLSVSDRPVYAHRHYYELANGPIPKGLQIDHLCRVRACVNPEHMEPVTCAENLQRGKKTKLTEAQVQEIRKTYVPGQISQAEVGAMFGVSGKQVGTIVRGENWGSLKEEG
jgi:hypothetical protein